MSQAETSSPTQLNTEEQLIDYRVHFFGPENECQTTWRGKAHDDAHAIRLSQVNAQQDWTSKGPGHRIMAERYYK